MKALTLAEVAAELGRSPDWLEDNWLHLVRNKGFPMPLHERGHKTWAAAHLYAWMDRSRPPAERVAAAVYRAAVEAAANAGRARREDDAVDASRARLARFRETA